LTVTCTGMHSRPQLSSLKHPFPCSQHIPSQPRQTRVNLSPKSPKLRNEIPDRQASPSAASCPQNSPTTSEVYAREKKMCTKTQSTKRVTRSVKRSVPMHPSRKWIPRHELPKSHLPKPHYTTTPPSQTPPNPKKASKVTKNQRQPTQHRLFPLTPPPSRKKHTHHPKQPPTSTNLISLPRRRTRRPPAPPPLSLPLAPTTTRAPRPPIPAVPTIPLILTRHRGEPPTATATTTSVPIPHVQPTGAVAAAKVEGRADGRPAARVAAAAAAAALQGGRAAAAVLGTRLHGPGGEAGAGDDALLGAVEADAEGLFRG
jgi:hypothetical protein